MTLVSRLRRRLRVTQMAEEFLFRLRVLLQVNFEISREEKLARTEAALVVLGSVMSHHVAGEDVAVAVTSIANLANEPSACVFMVPQDLRLACVRSLRIFSLFRVAGEVNVEEIQRWELFVAGFTSVNFYHLIVELHVILELFIGGKFFAAKFANAFVN